MLAVAAYLVLGLTFSEPRLYLGHALFGVTFVLLGWGLSLAPTPVLVNRFTRGIGVLSYSAYITHFAAIELAGATLARVDAGGPAVAVVLLFALSLGFTISLSVFTYCLVEQPGQRLGRWLIARIERATRPTGGVSSVEERAARRTGNWPPQR